MTCRKHHPQIFPCKELTDAASRCKIWSNLFFFRDVSHSLKGESFMTRKILLLLVILIFIAPTTSFLRPGINEPEETLQKELGALDDYLNKLDSVEGLIDRSAFDATALSRKLGHDQKKTFDFVRDRIGYQAYDGVLRGAQGTLLEGAGNSIDRSLLLLRLLQANGETFSYRFAQGTLSPSRTHELIAGMFKKDMQPALAAEGSYDPDETHKILGLRAKELERQEQEIGLESEDFDANLKKGVRRDYEFVTQKLSEKPITLDVDKSDTIEGLLESARKHYWLQVKQGEEWVDMDPCFPDSQPGSRTCEPEKTLESLDEALFHSLGVSVTIEKLSAGKTTKQLIYQNSKPAADLQGESVMVGFIPEALDIDALLKMGATKDNLLEKIDSFSRYQPVIDFGRTREYGRPFDLEGNTYIFQAGSFQKASEEGYSALGRRLFRDRKKADDHLSALWLEISLYSPGGKKTVFTRELVDRIGIEHRKAGNFSISSDWQDARRIKLALIRSYTMLPICSRFDADFALSKYFEILFDKRELLRIGLRSRHGQYDSAFSDLSREADFFPTHIMAIARLGMGFLPEFIPESTRHYYPQPNLYAYEESLDFADGEGIIQRCGYDLVSSRLRVVSPEAKGRDISASLLKHGILLSNLEVEMIDPSCGSMEPFSTHTVMEMAKSQNIGFKVILPGEREILDSMEINPTAMSRLQAELDRGYVVITPEKDVSIEGKEVLAWWRVDPKTSHIIGVTQWGRGQAVAEKMTVLSDISIPVTEKCLKYVACLLQGILGGGPLHQTNAECLVKFLQEVINDSIKRVRRELYIKTYEKMSGRALGDRVRDLLGIYWKIYDTWINPS
jgi:hypothetical protein